MRDSTSFDWNAGALATLKTMLAAGHSSREIAERLGPTRNAVIGKIHRLGLSYPDRPARTRTIRPRKPKPLPFIARRIKPRRKPAGPVHFREIEQHHCRWIPGEPSTQLYCGVERVEGSSYCSAHTRMSWQRTTARANELHYEVST